MCGLHEEAIFNHHASDDNEVKDWDPQARHSPASKTLADLFEESLELCMKNMAVIL